MSNLKEICENFDATIAAVKNTYQTKIAELEAEIEKLQLAATKPPVENTLHESTNPFEDKAKIEELETVKTQLAALTNELATTKANLEATEAKRKSVWKKYDNLMAQVNIIRENHKQELEKAQGSVSESITAKDAEITTLKARVGELVDEVKKLNAVIAEHERNEVNQSAYIDKLTEEFDMKTVSVSVVQRRCEEYEAEIKRLKADNEQHVKNVGVYKANEQYLSEQITRLKAENEQHAKNAEVYKSNEKFYIEQIAPPNTEHSPTNITYQLIVDLLMRIGSENLYLDSLSKQNNILYNVYSSITPCVKAINQSLAINAIIQYFCQNNTLPEKIIHVYPHNNTVVIVHNHGVINLLGGGKKIRCSRQEYIIKGGGDPRHGYYQAFTLKDGDYIKDENSIMAIYAFMGCEPVSNSVIIKVQNQ